MRSPLPRGGFAIPAWVAVVAVFAVLGIGVVWWQFRAHRPDADVAPLDIRGQPIDAKTNLTTDFRENVPAPLASNEVALAQSATNSSALPRKKRPKPGSYPQRLVQSILRGERTNAVEYAGLPVPAPKIVPVPPMPSLPGFLPLDFARLAGFEFDLRPEIANAGANAAAASAGARAQIPAEILGLDGRKIAVQGFIVPLRMDEGLAVEFLLMRDQTLCCFGRTPRINEWILVQAQGRGVKPQMDQPVTVCGIIHVADHRENGLLVGLYKLDAQKILEP